MCFLVFYIFFFFFFFFNDTATTEIYTLSLHDALPISFFVTRSIATTLGSSMTIPRPLTMTSVLRSEEHTSELQSQSNLVCRLLLEKKKKKKTKKTLKLQNNINRYDMLSYE